jgi:flagellar protein FlaJ
MVKESFMAIFLKVFWVIIALPLITFIGVYFYPAAEKNYMENKINQEIPFATIHMSAISQSMIEPSKIFSIIISTGEYPFLQREFTKIINQVNVYGYDLVTALRNVAFYNPSQKLSDLLNGLATTINSGGRLPEFFDKRAQSLLFDYRVEREKYTKTSETFMDIYISLVIAAPMILMLLLIMMRISGLGVPISTSMITLLMIFGVATINALFLIFLQLKQPQT